MHLLKLDHDVYPEDRQSSFQGGTSVPQVPKRSTRVAQRSIREQMRAICALRVLGVLANEIALEQDEQAGSNPLEFKITGHVVRLSSVEAEVDCFGGDKIVMLRSRTKGNWGLLQEGQWFSGSALICESGEVLEAEIESQISPPKLVSDNEIDDFYAKIMRAELTTDK